MNHEHELLERLRPERERGEIEVRESSGSFIGTTSSSTSWTGGYKQHSSFSVGSLRHGSISWTALLWSRSR